MSLVGKLFEQFLSRHIANLRKGNFTIDNDRTGPQQGIAQPGQVPRRNVSQESSPDYEKVEDSSSSESPTLTRALSREEIEEHRRDREVLHLARRYTTQSHHSVYNENPFEAKDSILDPASPNFSPRAFAKSLLNLQARDPEKWKQRTAGFSFKDLNVYGFGSATDYQKSVGNVVLEIVGMAKKVLGMAKPRKINILQNLDGVVRNGEMLVVLGPPGSGCSTFLKTIAGETSGFYLENKSQVNYQGISPEQMHKEFRGEAIYTAEVDVHFPMLSVGQTLEFAAIARAPRYIPGGISRLEYARYQRDVIMAVFGISHTINTRVGNDFVRGVSGGERKRVTIAEAALSAAPLQCWDNSTRGLDSANAIEFCKTLRMSTDILGSTAVVAIYQAPQSAYDVRAFSWDSGTFTDIYRSSTRFSSSTRAVKYTSDHVQRPRITLSSLDLIAPRDRQLLISSLL
jgi:ABC-type multidrug transport system ATPase subunit